MIALFGRSWKFGRDQIAKVRSWSGRSVNRRIFISGISTGFGAAVAKFVLALRELVIAYQFGAAPSLGAFLIAAVLPSYCAQIVVSSVPLVFIPALIRERDSAGATAAARLFAMTSTALIGLLAAVSVLMVAGFPAYLDVTAAKFSPPERALAADLMVVLIPFMLLRGLNVAWSAALGAEKRFLLPALIPAITPAVTAIAAVGWQNVSAIACGMPHWAQSRAAASPSGRHRSKSKPQGISAHHLGR